MAKHRLLTVCAAMVALASIAAADGLTAKTGFYGPRIELKHSRAAIQWQVWSDGAKVTASEMWIDGEQVASRYDYASRTLLFTPSSPLRPGIHKVHCQVTFQGKFQLNRDWETKVAADAVPELDGPGTSQFAALAAANAYRKRTGLPPLHLDSRMIAAARAHSAYMDRNRSSGHYERATDPLFTGVEPCHRLEAFGWGGSSWEGVTYGPRSESLAIASLFDAPYHRIPFLQPGDLAFGYGGSKDCATAEFEGTSQDAAVASPADGETDVPTTWLNRERPNPVRMHATRAEEFGYPIVLAVFDSGEGTTKFQSGTLRDDAGNAIPCFFNSPDNDKELNSAAVIIPSLPLSRGTRYRYQFTIVGPDGKAAEISGRFTTAK